MVITENRVFDIRSLTWDKWSNPQELLPWGTIRPEDSRAERNLFNYTAKLKSPATWACQGMNLLGMPKNTLMTE